MPNSSIAAAAGNLAAAPHHHRLSGPALATQAHMLAGETKLWLADNWMRILIAGAIGLALVAVFIGVKKLGERLCPEGEAAVDWRTIIGRVAHKTMLWFIVMLAAKLVDNYAETPPQLDHVVGFFFTIALTFQAAIWVREVVLGFVEYRAELTDQDHSALGSALGIIRFLVTFTLFAIALVLVLDNVGVNVTGLVAGLGIGGIAIGFAAQGIFKDLFAALAIIFDKPFRKGDSVKWNGVSGTVERIGLKTTRIRATTGELMIVGNANLLDKELFNFARLDRRRMVLAIRVSYSTPDDVCARVPALLREITEGVPRCEVVRVGLVTLAESSLDFELQFDVMSANYNEVFDARSAVCLAILRRFNELDIEFAFPTHKTIPAGPDGKALKPPKAEPKPAEARPEPKQPAAENLPPPAPPPAERPGEERPPHDSSSETAP
ncbi:MAG TPA: mechanosensitive ion channel family protein [Sphingomonas sp.]|nr:mechanosensitive ion channel family protein [Sphingomonas sp.]